MVPLSQSDEINTTPSPEIRIPFTSEMHALFEIFKSLKHLEEVTEDKANQQISLLTKIANTLEKDQIAFGSMTASLKPFENLLKTFQSLVKSF